MLPGFESRFEILRCRVPSITLNDDVIYAYSTNVGLYREGTVDDVHEEAQLVRKHLGIIEMIENRRVTPGGCMLMTCHRSPCRHLEIPVV